MPAPQTVQFALPAAEKVPAAQAPQEEADTAPRLGCAVPAGHAVGGRPPPGQYQPGTQDAVVVELPAGQ